jgi:hypothetical protein
MSQSFEVKDNNNFLSGPTVISSLAFRSPHLMERKLPYGHLSGMHCRIAIVTTSE